MSYSSSEMFLFHSIRTDGRRTACHDFCNLQLTGFTVFGPGDYETAPTVCNSLIANAFDSRSTFAERFEVVSHFAYPGSLIRLAAEWLQRSQMEPLNYNPLFSLVRGLDMDDAI